MEKPNKKYKCIYDEHMQNLVLNKILCKGK
jgi:hypothetical protein